MKLIPLKEAAQMVGLSCYALRQGTKLGEYPVHRAGNRYLYDIEALEAAIHSSMKARQREAVEQWQN